MIIHYFPEIKTFLELELMENIPDGWGVKTAGQFMRKPE
jgi:hypothetical protein